MPGSMTPTAPFWTANIMQVTGLGALVVTPIVGNLSDRYGRKALMTLPVTVAVAPLCK